jgi:hypothetical protein
LLIKNPRRAFSAHWRTRLITVRPNHLLLQFRKNQSETKRTWPKRGHPITPIGNFFRRQVAITLAGRVAGEGLSMGDRYWLWMGVRLLVAVAIVAWVASYLGTGSGEKEFQKTLEAMKQIHSFRVAYLGTPNTQRNQMLWEVDCKRNIAHSQSDYVNTCADPPDCSKQSELKLEDLAWGSWNYERQHDGSWAASRHPASDQTKYVCGRLAQGIDSNLLPPIATMIQRGILQKGDKKTVNGVRCREWLVTIKGGPMGLEHDTVCLGLKDHLPYEMTVDWGHSRASFSDYNTEIEFDLPAEVVRATSANGSN